MDRNGGRRISRRSLLTMGAAAAFGVAAPKAGLVERRVTLGQVSLSFYAVAGAVVREILEQLGHRVEVREGPHEEIFPLLGTAAVDVMAAAWLPEGHAALGGQRRQAGAARGRAHVDARQQHACGRVVRGLTEAGRPDVSWTPSPIVRHGE